MNTTSKCLRALLVFISL